MGSREPIGSVGAPKRIRLSLPPKGKVKRYILTSAQNNTDVHGPLWKNLMAFAKHVGAEVMVGSYTYSKPAHARGQKKTAKETAEAAEWWAPEVTNYLADQSIQIAPGLVWCGELQILPTANNPISGLESYTGRDSCIIPHSKFALKSVPSPKGRGTKLIFTSGTVTLRNYIEKKAGQKASFHHGYGGTLVEVTDKGRWFVRQLNADSEGVFYDLDCKVRNGRVTTGHRPEAIVWGDAHVAQLEGDMRDLAWGDGGILDTLRPRRQVLHDVLDFRAANHHDLSDPWKQFAKHCAGRKLVGAEVAEAAMFLVDASRKWCETVVVCSNHDLALERWLKETDHRDDLPNALFHLEQNRAAYAAFARGDASFYSVEHAFRSTLKLPSTVRFLRTDEEYIVCPDASGGIDLGHHGHAGPNGGRGSVEAFARTGRKVVLGHSHSAAIVEGAYQVGVMARLDQGYNKGPSSWSHTNCLVYPNGKRTMITIWEGRWRA